MPILRIQGAHLSELQQASCPLPFGPALRLFKFVPDNLVRLRQAVHFERPPRMGGMYEIVGNNFVRTGGTRRMTTSHARSSKLNSPGTPAFSDSRAT